MKNSILASSLLSELESNDIHLKLQEGKIGYDAPPGAFTDELKERVRSLRKELADLIASRGDNGSGEKHPSGEQRNAVELLVEELESRDIHLKIQEGKLAFDAPSGSFTDELKERVRAMRDDLVRVLSASAPAPDDGIIAPLTFGQGGMWFLNQVECSLGIKSGEYTEHLVFELSGPLDRKALETALTALTAHYGVLRTLFREGPNGPEQVVAASAPLNLVVVDLGGASKERLEAALAAAAHRPLDLSSDPHICFNLYILEPERHIFSVSAHHAAWDGWSNSVFSNVLALAYNAARAGRKPELPKLRKDVADLARAQHEAWTSGALDDLRNQLLRSLDGYPQLLDFPFDRPRSAVADGRGELLDVRLEPEAVAGMASIARRVAATPYMVTLAAWSLLLSRLTGSKRLVIGAPVAARESSEVEQILGYLANTVPIAVNVGAAASFGELVAHVRDQVLHAMSCQRVPYEKVIEAIAPARSRSTTPLVQTLFAMQPREVPAPGMDGLRVKVLPYHNRAARCELILNLEMKEDGALEGPLVYATALFDRSTIAGWAERWLTMLRSAPQQWDDPIDRFATEAVSCKPEPQASPEPDGFETATERALAGIWGEFLQTKPQKRDDDFFILGGHSLLLMRIIHRITSFGLGKIELADALGATRLSAMAALIDERNADNGAVPAPPSRSAAKPSPASTTSETEEESYPRDASMVELWKSAATRFADRVAMTLKSGSSMTYAELDRRSDRIADGILATGVSGGTVAMLLDRGFDAVATILAIWKAGMAYLPLDHRMPPAVVERLAADADARLLVTGGRGSGQLAGFKGIRLMTLDELSKTPTSGRKPPVPRGGAETAYVMFTSGTTGVPKGVSIPHRAIVRMATNKRELAVHPHDVLTQSAPLAFDASTFELWTALLNGASLRIVTDDELLDHKSFRDAVLSAGTTVLWLTSGLFCRFVDDDPEIFSKIRLLLTGGECMSTKHVQRLFDARPDLLLYNCYGPTENCCFTTLHVVEPSDLKGAVPIGHPIEHTKVYIVDEQLNPVPDGTWGELLCAGDGLATGYSGQPELTAASFVTLPWGACERAYRSGDIARRRQEDGLLEFGGRRDEQVKIRGHRIETSAIESVLAEGEGVHEAAVLVTGEGADKVLTAFVVTEALNGRAQTVENSWRHLLSERLPLYMMPARFVMIPGIPLKQNGKRDRDALLALAGDNLPPQGKADRSAATDDFPLSTGQERLWVMQQLFPGVGFYNVALVFEMRGPLDPEAFSRALIGLEERHHALRSIVVFADDGTLRQRIVPAGGLRPSIVDLTGEQDPAMAVTLTNEEVIRPFLLEREPGARAILMHLDEHRWQAVLVFHHAIIDGWSLDIVMRELTALYGRETGLAVELPPAPEWQFEDVAAWQREHAESPEAKALLDRWIARLSPLPRPLDLPADRKRPPVMSFRGAWLKSAFSAEQSKKLVQFAAEKSVTPFALVTGLVQVLLHRLTGETDLAIGTLVAGRDRSEMHDTIGFMVNTLVLRQEIDPGAGFRILLSETRSTCIQAINDQHCPFVDLVTAIGAPRDRSRSNPLFDTLVVFQGEDVKVPVFRGLETRRAPFEFPFAKFDIAFHFWRQDEQINCEIEYNTDLFEEKTIQTMFDRLDLIAANVLLDPERPLSALPITTDAELSSVVEGFNATSREFDTRRTVVAPFLDAVDTDPTRPALLWEGGQSFDYRTFSARAGAVASRLAEAGVRPGDTVGICTRRSPEMLVAIYGILMAGAAYAPLGADDPAARIGGMLDDLGQPVVLADAGCREKLQGIGARLIDLEPACRGEATPRNQGSPDDLAYILFTSGSTGRPKGVAIEHHSVLNRILWMQETFPIGPGDVILQKTPVTFDVSVWELFWWSWVGASLAVPPPGTERDPLSLVDFIDRFGVTVLHFVPSMLAEFLSCLEDGRAAVDRLKRLRFVFSSGEALEPELVERFDRLLYRPLGVQLHNLYGPTEATVDVTWHSCSPWEGGDVVPIGRPIAHTTLYVLDRQGNPTPIGVAGEILLGGVQVARGYLNRPELDAERFVPDPFRPGGRLYRTGDLGRWRADGTVEYLGRMDNQVKVRGQRIETGEVEHALEKHPSVERALVVPATVHGLTELHAFLLPRGAVDPATLRNHLRELVTTAMVPSRFFSLEKLPLTSSGKIDRKSLSGTPLDTVELPLPAGLSEMETEIRQIWKTLLPEADPGPNAGFFDAGGNSLLVIRLHEKLNNRWPGQFSVADLFGSSTIREQAALISSLTTTAPTPPAPLPATAAPVAGNLVPLSSEERGVHDIAIVGMACRLPGSEDAQALWVDVSRGADLVRKLPSDRESEVRTLLAALGIPAPEEFGEAAYLDDVMGFDFRRFRMSPADAALLDPEQRLFLETALRSLEDAGRGGAALDGAKVGVFVGGAPGTSWRELLMRNCPSGREEQVFALNVPSNIATRLSFLHDWKGPAAMIDTACSSSLVAIHHACRALRAGDCDWALAGGAKVLLVPQGADQLMTINSSTGRTHAFSEGADGTGSGEGSVVFLLRPLFRALADGDPIHGVILGSAVNQDGASSGMAAPNPAAQADVIVAAARDAGVPLSSISYIEAHGTGTTLGDPVEIDGLTRAFGRECAETGFAFIGSAKGNYGHLDGAAGALGLCRALMCLGHDSAPPQPFFDKPNPRIDFGKAPVRVSRDRTQLGDRGGPRRAGVSAFGLSGINAHLLVEAPPERVQQAPPSGWYVVGLSSFDAESLRSYAASIVSAMRRSPYDHLDDIARSLDEGRDLLDTRLAVWVRDRGDLMARLSLFTAGVPVDGLVVTGHASRGGTESVTAIHDREESAVAAATAFVNGARLAWPPDRPSGRTHLPAVPMDRRRCIPAIAPAPGRSSGATHLLGEQVVTPAGRFHSLDVHAGHFWPVADHRLQGIPTLVSMAFPSLLAEACPGKSLVIRELRWIRTLRPAELEKGTVSLSIGEDGAAALSGRSTDGRWLTFARATVEIGGDLANEGIGAEGLDALAPGWRNVERRKPGLLNSGEGIVQVSERWNCLEEVAFADDHQIGWLRIPGGEQLLHLHPGLLDVAAGLALEGQGLIPAGCAEISISGRLPIDPVAVTSGRKTDHGMETELFLADRRTGHIALSLRGLRFTRITSEAANEPVTVERPHWRPEPLATIDQGGAVMVIGDGPLAARIAAHLESAGRLSAKIDDPAALAHTALDRALTADIIFAPEGGSDVGARAVAMLHTLVAEIRRPVRLLAVGDGAFGVNGEEPLPWHALLFGVVTVAALEEPMLSARYVDADASTGVTELLSELAHSGGEHRAVAWRRGIRFVRHFEPVPDGLSDSGIRWPVDGCCVVVGGTGGLSVMLADTLANNGRVSLALLSRSGLPPGDSDEALARRDRLDLLRASGIRIGIYTGDVADRASLSGTLDRIRRELGPITAVVQNAAVSDGAFLSNTDRIFASYASSLTAKVNGTLLLDELTADDPIQAFVMSSSISGLAGYVGHAAYTGANAFLDAFAFRRRRQGKPALTIDWCLIREMGMAVRSGIKGDDPNIGGDEVGPFLRKALAADTPQVALLFPSFKQFFVTETVVTESAPAVDSPAAPAPVQPEKEPRRQGSGGGRAMEAALAAVWSDVLGYDTVSADADFYELGGDSIAGMRIVEQIVRDLGYPMTLVDLFETGTVGSLAERLRGRLAETKPESGLQPAPKLDRYPVAWEQLAVLRAEEAADMGTAYNLPFALKLPAGVDPERLQAAADALIERYEILRTRFLPGEHPGDEPSMEILPPAPAVFEVVDTPPESTVEATLQSSVRQFDLWNGLPMRFVLALLDGKPHALLLDVHHALADARSVELLMADLVGFYTGSAGPAPGVQLKDYAWSSRKAADSPNQDEARAYWLERFKGTLPVLDLPADRPRPAQPSRHVDFVNVLIEPGLLEQLRSFASNLRTTPFTVVTSAWALLLARYARTGELVIAVPFDSREGSDMARMAGMLVSLLPLRLTVAETDRLSDLVQRTHASNADAQRHHSFGLNRLLADLAPPAAPERALLSEVMLSYMNFSVENDQRSLADGGFTPLGLERSEGKSDLAIFVRDLPDSMLMTVEYATELFDRERIERMGKHLQNLLAAFVSSAPDRPAFDLPLIDQEEAAWLASAGEGSSAPLPLESGLFGLFAERASATPDAVALEERGRQLTYRELYQRAAGIAASLRNAGVEEGDRVGLLVERSAEAIVLLLGIVAAGAAYVPFDPAWPAERIALIGNDAGCRTIIADAAGRERMPSDSPFLPAEELVLEIADEVAIPPANLPAHLMYTSGSTGTPKGVLISQRGVIRLALSGGEIDVTPQDRVMQTGPLAFDASTYEIWATLLNGARLCVAGRDEVLDPDRLRSLMKAYGATILWITTGLFNQQVEADPATFRGLRRVIMGGETASPSHLARAMSACQGVTFLNAYGPTENTCYTTVHHVTPADTRPGPVPIGKPIAQTRVMVCERGGSPAPVGVWGEIVVAGTGLADGYLHGDDRNFGGFVEDPADPSSRRYLTGDLGRWRADGVLEFGGRRDSQIKLRGFRIELEEIEHALNRHPGVAASVVLFLRAGESGGSIVACIQPHAEQPDTGELREWLGRKLPAYMVPSRFVLFAELPVNANGKLDRSAIEAAVPPPETPEGSAGEPPRDDAERLLADIFSEIFNVPVNDRNASFVGLGGHSLLAIRAVNRIAGETGIHLSMSEFFSSGTVAGLAAMTSGNGPSDDLIVHLPDAPSYPASHAQARLYLANRMTGGDATAQSAYNITIAQGVEGAVDPDLLLRAMKMLTERHETLRTCFAEEDGRIVQRIAADVTPALTIDDVASGTDPYAEALRLARREASTPFDLEVAPLFRARAVRLAVKKKGQTETWLIILVVHHIVGDGWSVQLLTKELNQLYEAVATSTPHNLPELPVAYRDFTVWQNHRDWTDAAAYWRSALAGAPERIVIPTDRTTQMRQSNRGDTVRRNLPDELVEKLRLYARRHDTTLASVGLALFASLLYRLSRQGDMVVGMGSAGRDRVEVEGLIGFFVNVLPIRIRVSDETEFGELVDRVHASVMEAMDHRDYPFDLLVRTMAPQRIANRQPLINVVFEYHHFDHLLDHRERTERSGAGLFDLKDPFDGAYKSSLTEAIHTPTAKHDLLLFLSERSEGTALMLEYDTDLLDRGTAERWLAYLEQFAAFVTGSHSNPDPS